MLPINIQNTIVTKDRCRRKKAKNVKLPRYSKIYPKNSIENIKSVKNNGNCLGYLIS